MTDGREPQSHAPLSVRVLTAGTDEPIPAELSRAERVALAEAKVNTTLKGWRLVRLLGVGPVGAAYEAVKGVKDAAQRATLKLMVGNVARHERARSLFLRAAYAANRFQHARVLPVIEDGVDGAGAAFVVRPWPDAEPLDAFAERLRGQKSADAGDGKISAEGAILRIGEQVLDALEMAHAHGIIHGAIAPSNILVTPRGSIRLCDFATPPGLGARATSELDGLAQLRMGPFTAPERCTEPPQPTSEQSDVYAVAACMYYAISGVYPRGGPSGSGMDDGRELGRELEKVDVAALGRTPAKPLREVAPDVSEGFAAVVDHGLAFDPIYRYDSAYAMLGDVRRVMAGRKPKLGDAAGPLPSQSTVDALSAPASSRRIPLQRPEPVPSSRQLGGRPRKDASEWKGNVALIFAIALLVGVATFVVVREKIDEVNRDEGTSSSESR